MEIVVPDEFKHLYVTNAERPVIKIPHPVLRQRANDVTEITRKTSKLIDEMIQIMKLARGIGLAAPQVGVGKRIIIVAPEGMKPTALVNPVIVESEGESLGQEGCLSIPGLYGNVFRSHRIVVEAYDRNGKPIGYELEGMPARVVQHEIDHLDGVLFIDKVLPETLHWQDPDASDDDTVE
ncbi:MAG: peptide deformylase [Armatimonadetes bacterium]|nr:peptide deformylase [Armatimonadota bacterium]